MSDLIKIDRTYLHSCESENNSNLQEQHLEKCMQQSPLFQAVQMLVVPRIQDAEIPEFLWQHILTDLNDLQRGMGKSIDDIFVLLHATLDRMTKTQDKGRVNVLYISFTAIERFKDSSNSGKLNINSYIKIQIKDLHYRFTILLALALSYNAVAMIDDSGLSAVKKYNAVSFYLEDQIVNQCLKQKTEHYVLYCCERCRPTYNYVLMPCLM